MAQVLNINRERRALGLVERMDRRREEGKFNFTIIVGEEKIFAEQFVLSCGSEYFDKMLSHDTKERQKGELHMLDVDFESVKTCIDFIYGREVSVSTDKYEDLMFVANMMLLKDLCKAIEENMKDNLGVKSFFLIREIAIKFECNALVRICQTFAEVHFDSISKEEKFQDMEKSFIVNLLKSSNVSVKAERKLEILLEWVWFDEDREKDLLELIQCIDVSLIPRDVGQSFISNEPLINSNNECLRFFSLSLYEALSPEENILLFRKSPNLRLLNPRTNELKDLTVGKPNVENYSVLHLQSHIYVLGGDKSLHRYKYSEEGAAWEKMADMNEAHGDCPPATILSGFIYVIGGSHNVTTRAVERFIPAENEWAPLKDLSQAISKAEILSSRGFIYSFGGRYNNAYVSDVTRFDVSTSQWKNLSPMREKKGYVSAAEWKGNIFVAGGFYRKGDNKIRYKTFESYSPSRDQWTAHPEMNIRRSRFKLIPIDGALYAVGGLHSRNSIEKYDFNNDEWEIMEIKGQDGYKMDIVNSVIVARK